MAAFMTGQREVGDLVAPVAGRLQPRYGLGVVPFRQGAGCFPDPRAHPRLHLPFVRRGVGQVVQRDVRRARGHR